MPPSFPELLFWGAVVCCAIAQAFVLRSVFAARAHPRADAPTTPRRGTEVLWAVVPVIALAVVLVATWNSIRSQSATRGALTPVSAAIAGE